MITAFASPDHAAALPVLADSSAAGGAIGTIVAIVVIVLIIVGGYYAQHVVNVARHAVEFHHLRHGADGVGKLPKPGFRVVGAFNGNENRHTEPSTHEYYRQSPCSHV